MLSVNIFINKLVVTDKKRVINTPLTVCTIYIKRTYLTKKELESIKELQDSLSKMLNEIGKLDFSKYIISKNIESENGKMEALKSELEKKYGSVNIDLQTGSIKAIESSDAK